MKRYTYHYLYDTKALKSILQKGLIPVNKTKKSHKYREKYKGRNPGQTSDEYFKWFYDNRYKPILNKSYKNYGIYTTPLNLNFVEVLKYKISIDIDDIINNSVIQMGPKVWKLSYSRYDDIMKKINRIDVEKIYNKSRLHFQKLPQIVYFSDVLKIQKEQVTSNI